MAVINGPGMPQPALLVILWTKTGKGVIFIFKCFFDISRDLPGVQHSVGNMPLNNNQKAQSAAARLAKLPVVRSACVSLSVLYGDAKRSLPVLRSACEALEGSVTAIGAAAWGPASPVLHKLEPHISVANEVACITLDWLETTFPVLHAPTEQIVAAAKNKMFEVQAAVSVAANGTVERAQHTVAWLTGRTQRGEHLWVLSAAGAGLDSAVVASEALMDRVLPPAEEEEVDPAEGFEAPAVTRSRPAQLLSLGAKLCKRTQRMWMERCRCSGSGVQSGGPPASWSLQQLQHQLASLLFFISQMYYLCCPPPHRRSDRGRSGEAAKTSTPTGALQKHPEVAATCRKRPAETSTFGNGCDVPSAGH